MAKPTHFQSEFDKVLSGFVKEAGGPPPLPDDVYELNPWAEEEGEDKPIGMMSQEELANFVRTLDPKTFGELKGALDKLEMPEADDVEQNLSDRHTRPTVETLVDPDPKRHTRPTVMTLAPEAKEEKKQEFLSSPDFEAAFHEWMAGQGGYESSPTFDEAYSEHEKVAEVRLSKRAGGPPPIPGDAMVGVRIDEDEYEFVVTPNDEDPGFEGYHKIPLALLNRYQASQRERKDIQKELEQYYYGKK